MYIRLDFSNVIINLNENHKTKLQIKILLPKQNVEIYVLNNYEFNVFSL